MRTSYTPGLRAQDGLIGRLYLLINPRVVSVVVVIRSLL